MEKKSVMTEMSKLLEHGLELPQLLPSLPIPAVLLAKASMTATSLFDIANNTFNDHKEDIAEFLKTKIELLKNKMVEENLVVREQTLKTLQDIQKIQAKTKTMEGGATFSQEECTFF
jgi:hypothetical protein